MFLFNKGHGQQRPGSRQSFFDSHGPEPSTVQHWDRNPPLDASGEEHQRPPSSSGQERGIIGKRTSLLPMRSRSDTATSAASNISHTSLMAPSEASSSSSSSKRLSQDLRLLNSSQTGRADTFEAKPRTSLFSRGKILKRTSRIGPELNVNGEHYELGKRLSVLRRDGSKKTPRPQESSNSTLRHRISSPFDFQHLTHTAREHISALDSASQSDLAAEFMAVRHSQMPRRELTGIRVEDLAIGQGSTHSLPDVIAAASEGSLSSPSPTRLSPVRSRDQVLDGSPSPTPSRKGSLKHSRSVESFSQPKIRSSARVSMGIAPPPRLSSRTALSRIDDEDGSSSMDGLPRRAYGTHRYSGIWSPPILQHSFSSASPAPCIPEDDDEGFAHAVTTPGDAAVPTLSPAFALENVPEEPESYFNPRPAPQPPVRQSSLFRDLKSPDLRQLTESPQLMNRLSTQSTIRPSCTPDLFPRSDSRASTTLGPAFNPRPRFGSSPPKVASLRRQSILQEFDACWEDDIDYCYDHAAEADCDYDWDRNSLDIKEFSGDDGKDDSSCHTSSEAASSVHGLGLIAEEEEDETMRNHFFGGNFRPSLLVPETSSLPDLVQRSSLSPSTTETSLRTPSDASQQTPSILTPSMPYYDNGFAFHPPLLLPQEAKFQGIRDDMYDELLAEYQSSEKHYPILDGSSVSSATRLSKRSSYDSSIRSGSGSLYSTMRRSASSAGSLPDLVHSRRSTRRVIEVLPDQMTFANLDSDDIDDDDRDRSPTPEDDSTPTNITEAEDSTSSERTFFATEDEETQSEAPSVTIEEDSEEVVREPIRRAPTPPPKVSASSFELDLDTLPPLPVSPAPMMHHERAASESTAKLMSFGTSSPNLSPTQVTRQRSASHSKARRGPRRTSGYTLSLFPPPPKDGASPVIPSLPTMS